MSQNSAIEAFRAKLRGELLQRDDPAYEEVRKLYNAMIDRRPMLIARCLDVADVIAAVQFGREQGLLVAVRSGGHNGPGLASCDDGLMIDLSWMKGVHVDPAKRHVRVAPGCSQGDVDHATHAFGLAVPCGIVGLTGIAGLTLGGGHGYLTRKYGLTIDNLIEADVVLADGRFVTANRASHEDLFWGLQGGGGNFGIVTSFVFKAHPVSTVYGGPLFWDLKDALALMQWYRDFSVRAPEDLCCFVGLKSVPSTDPFPKDLWGRKICALICCYSGPLENAEEAFRPIRTETPPTILDWAGPMAFPSLQGMFDALLPKGMQWYWKGDYVRELTDEAISVHLEFAEKSPSELSLMHLYPIDGAVHRVGERETAWACRNANWSMVIAAIDPDPTTAPALSEWAKAYWEAIHPHNLGGAYVNFLMEEGEERVRLSYGENYDRLVAIKRKYDPENFFRVNQNIRPT